MVLQQEGTIMADLTFAALRGANIARGAMFKNAKGETINHEDWSPNDWMVATFGELGEAAHVMKKLRRGDFTLAEARTRLAQEYADVVIYLDMMAYHTGIDLGEAIIRTFNAKSDQLELPLHLTADGPVSTDNMLFVARGQDLRDETRK